jgi:VWFA-related protein
MMPARLRLLATCSVLALALGSWTSPLVAQPPPTEDPPVLDPTAPAPQIPTAPPAATGPLTVEPGEDGEPTGNGAGWVLPDEFGEWLAEVDPILTQRERAVFLTLRKDYQRHAFIRRFWESRDPYPQTPRNELKDRWESRLEVVRSRFGSLRDDRARVFLLHGEPQQVLAVRCTTQRVPAEVWVYAESTYVDFGFVVIFGRYRGEGLARVYRPGMSGNVRRALEQARHCLHGDRLAQVVSYAEAADSDYVLKLSRALVKPRPRHEEWIDTFLATSTELPEDAPTFDAGVDVGYPGRRGNRTVLQALVTIPRDEVEVGDFAGHRSYDFLLNGEIVHGDELFEGFRYRFGFPAAAGEGTLPLAFERYLRPGTYKLLLRLEDMNSGRFFRSERVLEVPLSDGPQIVRDTRDEETARLFEEATAAIGSGVTTLRIVPPPGELHAGFVRIDTLAAGEEIDKVRFLLDGKRVLTRNRPPYNVEIDLGEFPRRRVLSAEALDADGRVVAEDEIALNAGGNRFKVRLVSPERGRRYERSLRAEAEVEVPDGRELERVEIYLDDTLMATLYQEPFVQPLPLPAGDEIAYVRAVGYLSDGSSGEDVVFVNAPENLDRIDVQFVELYTTVLDERGRPVDGLTADAFTVLEDGVPQTIARFERVENLPIHTGILIDTSGSMHRSLGQVRKAALSFLQQTLTPKDRAAIITFSKFPNLAVKLTNDLTALGGGLAGLAPEGETALYDSLIFSLYYFTGIRGQRAILLLSDGKDESSEFTFEETLEYARRAGVTIYTIGLSLSGGEARQKLFRLAEETGGNSFFIRDVAELPEIYEAIEEELRSQYLVAYQSSNPGDDRDGDGGEFRTVDLRVDVPKAKVNTISGYYP